MPVRERKDKSTRDRVDEIGAAMEAYRVRLDARYRRVTWLLIVTVTGGMVSVAATLLLFQGQRWGQTRDACERTNQQTDATVGLLVDLHADPDAVLVAKFRYPHVPPLAHRSKLKIVAGPAPGYDGPRTCKEAANRRVRGPRL